MDGTPRSLSIVDSGSGSASRRPQDQQSPKENKPQPRFSIRREGQNLRFLTARADQPRITQVMLETVRELPGPLGLVMVEVERVREWVVSSVPRGRVLAGLVSLRDLLGHGPLDIAVFSTQMGVEVFLDRWGTLEVRVGTWLEPQLRTHLERNGFLEVPHLSSLPPQEAPSVPSEVYRDRLLAVARSLGIDPDSGSKASTAPDARR